MSLSTFSLFNPTSILFGIELGLNVGNSSTDSAK
jgi:hypothetical protein